MKDRKSFPQAIVPDYLQKLEVDRLPVQTPYYIELESDDPWKQIDISVVVDRKSGSLYVDGTREVDEADTSVTPLGRIGLMRIMTIDDETMDFPLIADLRYTDNDGIDSVPDMLDAPTDQEEFNHWQEFQANLRQVSAFIAPLPGAKSSKKDGRIEPVFFGPEEYHDMLDVLSTRSDALIAKSMKKARKARKAREATKAATAEQPAQKQPEKPVAKPEAAPSTSTS